MGAKSHGKEKDMKIGMKIGIEEKICSETVRNSRSLSHIDTEILT